MVTFAGAVHPVVSLTNEGRKKHYNCNCAILQVTVTTFTTSFIAGSLNSDQVERDSCWMRHGQLDPCVGEWPARLNKTQQAGV
jgi:hypothetical protein